MAEPPRVEEWPPPRPKQVVGFILALITLILVLAGVDRNITAVFAGLTVLATGWDILDRTRAAKAFRDARARGGGVNSPR